MRGLPYERTPCRLAAAALLMLGLWGCKETETAQVPAPPTQIERSVEQDGVRVRMLLSPGYAQLGTPLTLSITAESDSNVRVELPALDDRVSGFSLDGQYEVDAIDSGGRATREWRAQLRPMLAEEYRIAPIAVTYDTGWLATPPIRVDAATLNAESAEMADAREPVWIYPPFRTVATWILALLAGVALLVVLWRLLKRVKREVELRRMSPRERALLELRELLDRELPEHDQTKEFYFELTMIVRRYIERAHAVRAPEQTTEEFLTAITADARFTPATLERLRAFLQAADLVKYAAYQPGSDAVAQATGTAQSYIETDASASEPAQEAS